MYRLTRCQVGDNVLIGLDGGQRAVLDSLSREGRIGFICRDPFRDEGCISQRGTFLRRSFDLVG